MLLYPYWYPGELDIIDISHACLVTILYLSVVVKITLYSNNINILIFHSNSSCQFISPISVDTFTIIS